MVETGKAVSWFGCAEKDFPSTGTGPSDIA